MKRITVFLVDDHRIFLEGLRFMLNEERGIEVIGQADSGRAALNMVPRLTPNVVVLDVRMPDIGGIDATSRLLASVEGMKIVALSASADPFVVHEMLRVGASGFVTKSNAGSELAHAIRVVVRQNLCYLSPEVSTALRTALRARHGELSTTGGPLAQRERDVLRLIAAGASSKQIAVRLDIAVATADVHRRNIMRKLKLHSVAELTKYAIRHDLTALEK